MMFNRLGVRILAVVIILLTLAVGGIGYYAMREGEKGLTEATRLYEATLTESIASSLDATVNRFDGMLQAMGALVTARFTSSMLNADVADIVVPQFAVQNSKFLSDLVDHAPEARSLFITFNPEVFGLEKVFMFGFRRKDEKSLLMYMDGKDLSAAKLLERSDPTTSWFWTPLTTGRGFWGDIQKTPTGEDEVAYTMPVMIEGKVIAVAGLTFSFDFVRDALKSVKIYDTGYAFLLNRNLKYLYHPTLSFEGPDFREINNGSLAQYGDDVLTKGNGRIDYPWEGQQKSMTYATLGNGYILFTSSTVEESLGAVNNLRKAIYLGIALVLLVAVVVVILFSRSISKPLQRLSAQAKHVADSKDLTSTVTADTSIEEIRDVAAAVNGMIAATSAIVGDILANSRNVLSRAEDMSAASEQSSASIHEVITLVGKVATNTQETASAIQEANAGVEEVASASQAGARAAAETGERAAEITGAAEKGGEALDEMSKLIDTVSRSGEQVSGAVGDLASSVSGITGFVNTITQIADQTNLLALNAAIEAARAGDAGRGFAVVAEEVRKLAEESNRAANQVGKVIGDISAKTENALKDQKGSAEQIGRLVERAKETKAVIDDVITKMGSISENVQSIAATMEEQSASAEEMTAGMDHVARAGAEIQEEVDHINQTMEEQGRVTENIARAAGELLRLSEAMEQSVGQFTIAEERKGLMPAAE
ncbi:MAG: methyl-accepting chemotaxis protein [Synergistaceae bacterium]|nr:methyl-accepting chemotaxis protein [Synergistaceae bacterium]